MEAEISKISSLQGTAATRQGSRRSLQRIFAALLAALICVGPLTSGSAGADLRREPAAAVASHGAPGAEYVPGRVIVKFRKDAPRSESSRALANAGLMRARKLGRSGASVAEVRVKGRSVREVVKELRASDLVFSETGEESGSPAWSWKPESLEDVQKKHIRKVLEHTGGNKKKAAEILGIERCTLYSKLKAFDIQLG